MQLGGNVSRRDVLRLAGLTAAGVSAAGVLAACSDGSGGSGASPASGPASGSGTSASAGSASAGSASPGSSSGSSPASSSSGGGSKPTITIGYWTGITQLAVMQKQQYLEKLGYQVKWQTFPGFLPAASQAMISGDIDMTLGNSTQAVSLFVKQPDLAWVVGQLTTNDPAIVARTGSGINSIEDIQGKTVATTGVHTANHAVLLLALAKAGIDPSTVKNKYVQTGTTSVISLFKQQAVDAAETFVPFSTTLVQQGLGKIIVTGDQANGIPFPSNSLIARQKFCTEHPQAVTDVLRCVLAANEYFKSNQDQAEEDYAKFSSIDVDIVKAAFASGQPKWADVVPNVSDQTAIVKGEVKYGVVDNDDVVDYVPKFLNPKFAKAAVKQGPA